MKILLIEDDSLLSMALAELLTANDYSIDLANNGKTGLELAKSREYDLILLDWLIPKLDGISLCRQLRSQGYQQPILLLSAKNCNADIVAGLDAGADDYVIKPYEPEALLARIRSLLRRSGTISSSRLTWENLCLDQTAGKVTYDEKLIALTVTEYNLLELFLQHPNRIFSRQVILDRLWGFDDAPVEHAVTTHIKDLRKKLKAAGLKEDILETVYGIGYRLKPAPNRAVAVNTPSLDEPESIKPASSANITAVNRVLERFRDSFSEQVGILVQAQTALLAGNLPENLHQIAKQEAHKLAGAMGTFGYPQGSQLARSIEHLLIHNRPFKGEEITEFSQLVEALQQELTKSPGTQTLPAITAQPIYCVLAIDDDTLLTERLQSEAGNWGMRLEIAADLATARDRLDLAKPDTVLLDLSFPDKAEDGLTLLRELAVRSPNLPIIVFTGRDSLADRLAVSRLGARQFLQKPATTEQIFQAIARVLPQSHSFEAKVLIVDDDPAILASLSALLTPWGLEVVTLSEPQKFWEVLITTFPDLVVLDLEMPIVSGLELCQVVRQDAHWGDIPILVVTGHTDAESLQQAFAAGADDFISKPVLGPELVTRVISRIQRVRKHWQLGRAREERA
ncbi:response regulator [Tolypothrix sp. FACHB-123]|uniref:response regulator n=1 Tax=Tolypothrix sp. FACHB-123 TaxID=2692868 RepID=UPI00168779EF|nr:response regulator [Tolypothrix sp. FACHB-123]MBD2358235.1 response regulator [Tolypothrix sp. FACHB-123]